MKRYQNILIPLLILAMILQPLPLNNRMLNSPNKNEQGTSLDPGIEEGSSPTNLFRIAQGSSYPGIPVALQNIQIQNPISSDWYNLSYHYRILVWVNETHGTDRNNELITIELTFELGTAYNNSILVLDNLTQTVIPFQVWNASYYPSTNFYQKVYVSWIADISAYSNNAFYVYWSDIPVSSPSFTGLNVQILSSNNVIVQNTNYTVRITERGIQVSVDGTDLYKPYSFAPSPFLSYPYNATYVLLDREEDTAYDDADHVRIIAWEDDTKVKIYGYNTTAATPYLTLLADTILTKYQVLRYPQTGPISGYSVLKIESDKPTTIIVGDLGTDPGYNAWGVDHGSDDDLYTYYGKEIVLWVPKDLWISAYFDDTHVQIIDLSDGDDSTSFVLNSDDFWYAFAGPNGTGVSGPPVFDDDIVKIVADKPVTIIGGFLDDNIFGEAKGHLQKKFIIPVFEKLGLIAYQNNTEIRYTIIDPANPSTILTSGTITLDEGVGAEIDITSWKQLDDDSGNPDDMGDLSYDEWAIAFVESNASISTFVGGDRATGGTWGGEVEYVGEFFAYVATDKDRYVKVFALEDNTYYEIRINGVLQQSGILNAGESTNYRVLEGQGAIITSDKPVITKMFGGWGTQVPSEDVSLLVNFFPVRLSSVDVISTGPILTVLKLNWEMQENLYVYDYLTIWNHSLAFTIERHLAKTPFTMLNGSLRIFDVELIKQFETQRITSHTESNVREYTSTAQNFVAAYWNATAQFATAIGVYSTQSNNNASIDYISAISGFFKETTGTHLIYGWNASVYLPGEFRNEIVVKFFVTSGSTGSNIWNIANASYTDFTNPVLISTADTENTLSDLRVFVCNVDNTGIPGASVEISSVFQGVSRNGYTNESGYVSISDIPASTDYRILIYWKNESSIFLLFPEANETFTNIGVNGSTEITFQIKVKDLIVNVKNIDGLLLGNSRVRLEANYTTNTENELLVNTTVISTGTGQITFPNMPLGISSTELVNYTVYASYNTTSTLTSYIITNETNMAWDDNPTVNTIDITIAVTKLTVNVTSQDGVGIPGASVEVKNASGSSIASKSTDITNKTVFIDIPTGINYKLVARYVGFVNDTEVVNVTSETTITLELPFSYGNAPMNITFDRPYYNTTQGARIRIFFTLYDETNNVTIVADTIWLDIGNSTYDIYTNQIPVHIGNGRYYYDLFISEEFSSGDYLVKPHAIKAGFATITPDKYNVTVTVEVPQTIKIIDFGSESEYWGANLSIWVNITDRSTGSPIVDANAYARILRNGQQYRNITLNRVGTTGTYIGYTVIDGNISVTDYEVNVTIIRPSIETTNFVFSLQVLTVPTNSFPNVTALTVGYYQNVSIKVTYQRTDPNRAQDGVTNANVTYVVYDLVNTSHVYPASGFIQAVEMGSGEYLVLFNTSALGIEGNYKIEIGVERQFHQNKTVTVLLKVTPRGSKTVPLSAEINVIYSKTAYIYVRYSTLEGDAIFGGALSMEILGVSSLVYNWLFNATTGYYVVWFDTNQTTLSIGTYTANITISKLHYETGSAIVQINILSIPTSVVASKISDTQEWSEEFIIDFWFNRTAEGFVRELTGADNKTFVIKDLSGTEVYRGELDELGSGCYRFRLNTTEIGVGTFSLTVFLKERYHENHTLHLTLTVIEVQTIAYAQPENITLIWSDIGQSEIYYNRTETGLGISGATLIVNITDRQGIPQSLDPITITEEDGYYLLTINSTKMTEGSYIFYINITRGNYTFQQVIIYVTIEEIPTSVSYPATITAYLDENFTIRLLYYDLYHSAGVTDATLDYTIMVFGTSQEVSAGTIIIYDNGTYVIKFTAEELQEGSYTLEFTIAKAHYEGHLGSISIKIRLVKTTEVYDEVYDVVWGDNITIEVNIISQREGEGGLEGLSGTAVLVNASTNDVIKNLTLTDEGNGQYVIIISTSADGIPIGVYRIDIEFTSKYYEIDNISITLNVNPIVLDLKYDSKISTFKNPVTGEATTTFVVRIYDTSRNGLPVSNATVKYYVMLGDEVLLSGTMTEDPNQLGTYTTKISWTNLEPNTYSIVVQVEEIKIQGQTYSTQGVVQLKNGAPPIVTARAEIDYLGGTTKIAGMKLPTVVFVPSTAAMLILVSVLGYKLYRYYKLPIEVREIEKIIKMLEKGEYFLETPPREEILKRMIEDALE